MPTPPQKPASNAIINPTADKRLARLALSFGAITFVLLIITTFAVPYADARYHLPLLPKSLLNGASLLVVLIPFYAGIYRLFTARLEIGRERVQARAWTEAVAALEPFDAPTQRFLDKSGEAHYLLAQAYTGTGDKVRAERARAFVRRRKGSPWAEKLMPGKGPSLAASRAKAYDGQEKRPTPPKTKPRRRF